MAKFKLKTLTAASALAFIIHSNATLSMQPIHEPVNRNNVNKIIQQLKDRGAHKYAENLEKVKMNATAAQNIINDYNASLITSITTQNTITHYESITGHKSTPDQKKAIHLSNIHNITNSPSSSLDTVVDAYTFLQSAQLSPDDTLTITVRELNNLRAAANLSSLPEDPKKPLETVTTVTREEIDHLTQSLISTMGNDEHGQSRLSPKQSLEIFKSSFAMWGVEQRHEEVERLVNELLDQDAVDEQVALFRFLYQIALSQGHHEIGNYAIFYKVVMEEYTGLKMASDIFQKELTEEARKGEIRKFGPAWNHVKEEGMIEHFSMTPENVSDNSYIKDHTAIPLINFLVKDASKLFLKATDDELESWVKLIPYTPHEVIQAIRYILLVTAIKPESYGSINLRNKEGNVRKFIHDIEEAADNEHFVPRPIDEKFSDAATSFMTPAKFHAIPDSTIGLFDLEALERIMAREQAPKRFRLNMSILPNYVGGGKEPPINAPKPVGKLKQNPLINIPLPPPPPPVRGGDKKPSFDLKKAPTVTNPSEQKARELVAELGLEFPEILKDAINITLNIRKMMQDNETDDQMKEYLKAALHK